MAAVDVAGPVDLVALADDPVALPVDLGDSGVVLAARPPADRVDLRPAGSAVDPAARLLVVPVDLPVALAADLVALPVDLGDSGAGAVSSCRIRPRGRIIP